MREPETPGQKEVVQATKTIEIKDWVDSKELAEKLSKETGLQPKTVKAYISIFREKIESFENLETEERSEDQGRETVYWRSQK